MKNYRVTVNGNIYDVPVEEVAAGAAPVQSATAVPAPAAPVRSESAPQSVKPAAPAPTGGEGSTKVTSPMPGNILDIKVAVGDKVEAGACVVVLEAMKMENEITAVTGGTVASVNVTKGQTVASGDVLITIA